MRRTDCPMKGQIDSVGKVISKDLRLPATVTAAARSISQLINQISIAQPSTVLYTLTTYNTYPCKTKSKLSSTVSINQPSIRKNLPLCYVRVRRVYARTDTRTTGAGPVAVDI